MKYIKEYEMFDFRQTLPLTTANYLTNYYSCDECDALWKEYNEKMCDRCKYCDSEEIEELPENEWYEIAKTRLEPDEFKKLNDNRNKEADTLVDLVNLKNRNKKRYDN